MERGAVDVARATVDRQAANVFSKRLLLALFAINSAVLCGWFHFGTNHFLRKFSGFEDVFLVLGEPLIAKAHG